MGHPYHHAVSSAKKYGGEAQDYLSLHQFLDASKQHMADFRHRALRHHSEGIFLLEQFFGTTIMNSADRVVPVRFIGEQHVLEDLGRIPTVSDWLGRIQPEPWRAGRHLEEGDHRRGAQSGDRGQAGLRCPCDFQEGGEVGHGRRQPV